MIGRIATPLETPNNQPWRQDLRFWVGRTKSTPAELVGGSAALRLRGCGNDPIPLTIGNGRIVLLDNTLSLRITEDDMREIAPGSYDLEVQAELDAGEERQLRGVLEIVGGFS